MVQIIKSGTIKVPTQPKDFDLKATGLVFKSYDNQVALEFNVEKQDGTPADLLGANLRLLMFIYDEIDGTVTKEPIPFITKNLITESFLNGHVVYILPEAMKAYNGMVETYVYIEYSDGSTSDNLGFTFRMQRSKIDGLAQDKADYFITDFQQLLDAVKQKAADALNEALENVNFVVNAANEKIDEFADKMNSQWDNWNKFVQDSKDVLENIDPNGALLTKLNETNKNLDQRGINVLTLGLKNDGITDNYDKLTEIASTLPSGSKLFFPAGKYVLSNNFPFRKQIHIEGIKPKYENGDLVDGTV
ncbi:BppU family phage baseplate upper protein, partial [Enterococcus faecium]